MRLRDCVQAELLPLATEVFDRSWQFIERDPVLVGEDRRLPAGIKCFHHGSFF